MAKKEETAYKSRSEIQEEIRKAKGNPNKNIHAKKKNSNYRTAAAAQKQAQAQGHQLEKLPGWVKLTLTIVFILLIVALILNFFVMKDNELVTYGSAVYLGIVALVMYGLRNYTYMRDPSKRDSAGSTILSWMLVIIGVIYVLTGINSFVNYFRG